MRRFLFSAAIMVIVAGGPLAAQGGDREIAQQIIDNLKVHRDDGSLKDFTLDLKVDSGVVLLRGSVQRADQKANVLAAANGIGGISKVVDEIEVLQTAAATQTAEPSAIVRPKAAVAEVAASPEDEGKAGPGLMKAINSDRFSFKNALATAGSNPQKKTPGTVQMVAATESNSDTDENITAAVVATLGAAQRQGRLKGFGVDVNTRNGKVVLNGRASSEQQRRLISDLVRRTPGVVDVREDIAVLQSAASHPAESQDLELLPHPYAGNQQPQGGTPAMLASSRSPGNVPAQTAPYRTDQGVAMNQVGAAMPVPHGAPVAGHDGYTGMPVPMAPYGGVGAGPRLEQPYLPNYAWPGYAAYPNYAAVSYPQQYSPSAFPYIGPFYPYPQVPLGWRKVSLEWDDGWWFLDFTDR